MTKADKLFERGAERLHHLAEQAATRGGVAAKLAEPLAEDAAFLRKLKPSLVKARVSGRRVHEPSPQPVLAPPRPAHEDGPNPFAVIGAAAAAGVVLAKLIDWRGHAHPRD